MRKPVSFRKVKPKTWSVLVSKLPSESNELPKRDTLPISKVAEKLLARGVSKAAAESLANEFPAERIEEKLRYLDWLIKRNDKRTPVNVAGFLVAAIRNDYPLPKDYLKDRQRKTRVAGLPKAGKPFSAPTQPAPVSANERQRPDLSVIFSKLTPAEQVALEEDALAAARPLERESYERQKKIGGELFDALRRELLHRFLQGVKQTTA